MWRAYTELKNLDWSEHAPSTTEDSQDPAIARALASSSRLKCPPVRYVLAHHDGRAVGYCNTWDGLDGIGTSGRPICPPLVPPPRNCNSPDPLLRRSCASARRGTDGDCGRCDKHVEDHVRSDG